MSGTKEELTRNWLVKAKRDLLSARELAEADIPLLDTAAYHCQQAAEKAIKAFLLFHDVRFEKTHDIEVLVLQAIDVNPVNPVHAIGRSVSGGSYHRQTRIYGGKSC